MYFVIVIFTLFYGDIVQAKEFLRTGGGDVLSINDISKENSTRLLGLLVIERNENSEESFSFYKSDPHVWKTMSEAVADTDSSGDSNSDEYADSDIEIPSDTDSDSNYYHEENSDSDILWNMFKEKPAALRKKWKSCKKAGSKVCRSACKAAYKNACDAHECKKKFKKKMKKECKKMCKDHFK